MDEIRLSESLEEVDFATVTQWLAGTYWSPGVSRENVERAASNSSLVLSAFVGDAQIGYLRVVSDKTRFAYLCDVYVAEAARGKGLAKRMVRHCLEHSEYTSISRWLLATRDAHEVYAACGFEPINPAPWMIRLPAKGTDILSL